MPRLQPGPGYLTAQETTRRLNVSDGMLSKYVQQGDLKRYGPSNRKQKFYKVSEVQALIEARNFSEVYSPGRWRENPVSTFELALADDMPEIIRIGTAVFGDNKNTPEIRLGRLGKAPESYQVLRANDRIVGYVCILPLQEIALNRLVRDELATREITAETMDRFDPGKPLHVYIMAMCVDPDCTRTQKHEYGARLVKGTFEFFLDLAARGVEIETITARSQTKDGIRLLRKIGIPLLRSPVADKNLFSVRIADSGIPIFVKYSEVLHQWKREHQMAESNPVKA